jgi:hypothetical protein
MKILIIALPRTGSTSLLKKISKDRNLKSFFEPFDGTNRVMYNNEDNSVVKTIICHHPNNFELSKEFDKVILLTRKNVLENVESHSYSTYFSKTKNYNSNKEYFYEKAPDDLFELCYNNVIKWNNDLKELSTKLNIPITYYEDIYDPTDKSRLRKGNRSDYEKKII